MKRKAVDIQWDIDDDDDFMEFPDLPSEMEIPDDVDEDDISDYLSDTTGFCHAGFSLMELHDGEWKTACFIC